MAILNQEDFESVRRVIDTTLDDGVTDDDDRMLPDRVIADPAYADSVDMELFTLIPPAYPWPGTLTLLQQESMRRAAVYLTAARLYPRIPAVTQEQIGEHRYRREYESVDDVVARLNGEAMTVLGPLIVLLGLTTISGPSDRFRRAPACRGR